jgi:hypothetical protein
MLGSSELYRLQINSYREDFVVSYITWHLSTFSRNALDHVVVSEVVNSYTRAYV